LKKRISNRGVEFIKNTPPKMRNFLEVKLSILINTKQKFLEQ